jgi:2'-5' RNA ligase
VRLFVASWAEGLDLPPPAGFRPVPPEMRHLTLVFVGEEERLAAVLERLEAVARRHAPFPLVFTRTIGLPRPQAATVAAVAAEPSEAFTALALDLRRELRAFGEVRREGRPPLPHVTVGRRRQPVVLLPQALERPYRAEVAALALVESRLGPEGARYRAHGSLPLGPAPRAGDGVIE